MTVEIKDIPAVILAGGKGTRLQGLLPPGAPKCLAPIGDRVFLDILLRQIYFWGFRRVHLCLGVGADKVFGHFEVSPCGPDPDWTMFLHAKTGITISTTIDPEPRGSGPALVRAAERLSNKHIFVLNGDTLINASRDDAERLVSRHLEGGWEATVTVVSPRHHPGAALFQRHTVLGVTTLTYSYSAEYFWRVLAPQSVDTVCFGSHFVDIGVPHIYRDLTTFAEAARL